MEDINSILLLGVTATTGNQINTVEERLNAYEMQLDFIKALFDILLTSNNESVKLFASTYICVKFQHFFDDIPSDSLSFILDCFPNIFFSINDNIFNYYKKIAYCICVKGYLPVIETVLPKFLEYFSDGERIQRTSVLFYQLSKASLFVSCYNTECRVSTFILTNSFELMVQILGECDDECVKSYIMKSFVVLFRSVELYDNEFPLEDMISSLVPLFDVLVPILENTENKFFLKYFKCFVSFFEYLIKTIEVSEDFISPILEILYRITIEVKNESIVKCFFKFLKYIDNTIVFDYFSDKLLFITEQLIIPLYMLTPKVAELVTSNPTEFAQNNIYYAGNEDDILSFSVLCIKSLIGRYNSYNTLIVQYAQQAIEQYSQDQDSARLYSILHFCSRGWREIIEIANGSFSQEMKEIFDAALELTISSAVLLDSGDILAICAYLLMVSDFDCRCNPVIPIEITLACVQQILSDSPLVQYYACMAVESQLREIINSKKASAAFISGFSFDVNQMIQNILSCSSSFGDPHINIIITYCSKIPAFKSFIMEHAPRIIDFAFESAEEYARVNNEQCIFHNLMNIIDLVRDQPDVLLSITTYTVEKIVDHANLLESCFSQQVLQLANQIVLLNTEAHQPFYELATVLFGKVTELKNVDINSSICLIIHNLFISSMEVCDLEWLYQAIHEAREMYNSGIVDGLSYSLLLATFLHCVPIESGENVEEMLQFAIELISSYDITDLFIISEDLSELIYVIFTKFPEQSFAALEDPIEHLDKLIPIFPRTIDAIEICISIYGIINPESWVPITKEVFEEANPKALFETNALDEYNIDNFIISTTPLNPVPDALRYEAVIEFCQQLIATNPELAEPSGIVSFIYYVEHPEEFSGSETEESLDESSK